MHLSEREFPHADCVKTATFRWTPPARKNAGYVGTSVMLPLRQVLGGIVQLDTGTRNQATGTLLSVTPCM